MERSKHGLAFEDRRSCHLFRCRRRRKDGGRSAEVKRGRPRQRKAAEVKDAPPRDENVFGLRVSEIAHMHAAI
eukprot:9500933-Pyramimonas_sp.AAC.1